MKILVFGKSGQVGSQLAKRHDVVAVGREQVDLADPDACTALIRILHPDIIINAAAYTNVNAAEANEELATAINGVAPTHMARAAADLGVVFMQLSTDYVFSGKGSKPWAPDDPPEPINAYGRSKHHGEVGVLASGGTNIILRTSWIFSSRGRNFVSAMLAKGQTEQEIPVVSDQTGGPTDAADLANATYQIAKAVFMDNSLAGIYHYAGAPHISWANFAREILQHSGSLAKVRDITSDNYPTQATRPKNSVLDCSLLVDKFGIVQPDWRLSLARIASMSGQKSDG